jgi:SAM-dependent MidA family methyltransferase
LNASLSELLLSEIRQRGPLPFDHFMGKALYHPTLGFYASGRTRTGRGGDFLTPVSPGPVLGELLARQADELHAALDRPPVFHLVEQGADAGWLARDLFLSVQKNHPRLAPSARLHLVEPHNSLEQKQRQTLLEAGLEQSAQWHTSWNEFPLGSTPCFFYSCELVDSFPVKILQFRGGSWREKEVGAKDSRFVWHEREVDAETRTQIQRWNPPEIEGYTMELRPGVRSWVQSWAEKFSCGMVLTLDYGFPAAQLFSPARSAGTLVAIQNHQRVQDPLIDPGQLDLTAHVNFTELEDLAAERGFKNYGLTDFARGLTALAAPLLREDGNLSESWIRNFRHLTHPSFFGQSHQILVQGKFLPASFSPSILMKV